MIGRALFCFVSAHQVANRQVSTKPRQRELRAPLRRMRLSRDPQKPSTAIASVDLKSESTGDGSVHDKGRDFTAAI